MASARARKDRQDTLDTTTMQLQAINDLAIRGQIDADKAMAMEQQVRKNHQARQLANDAMESPMFQMFHTPKSNLPTGVAQTPKGDLGQHRGVEAKIAGAGKFKAKIMSTATYFKEM